MEPSIQLIDLCTGYKGRIVTSDINATLAAGELTCLLGPNGAGKSTLLKTLSAFIPPISGKIDINGIDSRDIKPRDMAQIIGVVLTERHSATNMTVEELVALGRTPYTSFWGSLRPNDKEIVDESIRLVAIDDLRDRAVCDLSDGERQKALIAKALAQQTQIILLDEPTAFLDYPSKVEIMKLLYRIAKKENKTIFMSTHDLELALQISDKIWLLDKTHGLNIGVPEDMAYQGLISKYFQRGGLKFNERQCAFEIEHDKHGRVRLVGDGILRDLAAKALNRIGYTIDDGTDTVIEVHADGAFSVKTGATGKTTSPISTIEELLNILLN